MVSSLPAPDALRLPLTVKFMRLIPERRWQIWVAAPAALALLLFGTYHLLFFARAQLQKIIRNEVIAALGDSARNIDHAQTRLASEQSALFIENNFSSAPNFKTSVDLLTNSVEQIDPDLAKRGLILEFGVFSGTTINFIAEQLPDTRIHGFDSFEGLPEDWRGEFRKGYFKMDGLPPVRRNVELHKGWFDAVLPGFKREHPQPIAFVHMDADLYSSTKTIFDELGDQIVAGTVIQFDEFFNYPGWRQGEVKAFLEFAEAQGVSYEYLGYCYWTRGEQVAIKVLAKGQHPPDSSDENP